MKVCGFCKISKPVTEFYMQRTGHYTSYCNPCKNASLRTYYANNKDKYRVYRREWTKANPLHVRLKRHGITVHELSDLLDEQEGKCGICKVEFSDTVEYHIDHDHKTGRIRGLLCERCNVGIGMFGDDPVRLRRAVMFLNGEL